MEFYKFLMEWAATDIEKHGFDDFVDMLAAEIPCDACPLRNKCDHKDCKATLHKELKVG